jgi:hypothetical protein
MRKVHGLSLRFINFYVPELRPRLNSTETSLQLSENIPVCCQLHIYTCHQQRDLDKHQVFGAYHFYVFAYIVYNVGDRTELCGTSA